MVKFRKLGAFLAAGALAMAGVTAQAADTLTIGSKAPTLDIEHWMSTAHDTFKPVNEFEDGKVYVVEFWATWCGPCIASMPHLAELQEEYGPKGVQLISVSDEDTDTVEKFLERKVRGAKEDDDGPATYAELTSAYCLTTDPDGSTHEAYMRAAAQNGIPTAFVVGKSGMIEWIGHPMRIDSVIEEVVADKWDRDSFAEEFKKSQEFDVMMMEVVQLMRKGSFDDALAMIDEKASDFDGQQAAQLNMFKSRIVTMQLDEMVKDGNVDEALAKMDELIEGAKGQEAMMLKLEKLNLLINAEKQDDAAKLLVSLQEAPPQMINQATWTIYQMAEADKDSVSEELLKAAVNTTEAAVAEEPSSAILDTLAHLVYVQGDLDKAIEIQTKAVEAEENADPQITGFLKQLKKEKKGKDKGDK